MIFDDILNDPATVVTAASTTLSTYWSDLHYLPVEIITNLAISYNSSFMTPIQEKFFTSFTSNNKLYSLISPPNTGTTTALAICALMVSLDYQGPNKILWISHSPHSVLLASSLLQKLMPSIKIKTENNDEMADVYMFSVEKSNYKKKAELYLEKYSESFKYVVFDGAEEILSTKEMREWVGIHVIVKLYQKQVGSLPILVFSQFHNSTHVATFIKEVEKNLTERYSIRTFPLEIVNDQNTFTMVKQYYTLIQDEKNWLKRLIGSYIIPLRKGVLVFGECSVDEVDPIGFLVADQYMNEGGLYDCVERIRKNEKKVLFCRKNIEKKYKTTGFGCVVHKGFPMIGNDIDIQEYRARVERVFSPGFIGISIVVVRSVDMPWVHSCSSKLNVDLEPFPM